VLIYQIYQVDSTYKNNRGLSWSW